MRLTPDEAAKKAGVSRNLIYRWCEERRLPHYRLGGRGKRGRILIEERDLTTFLESCRVSEAPEPDEGPFRHIR
jgi:excisionase family DNA binding protein